MNTPYMTAGETAERLHIGLSTVYELIQKRVIPHKKFGKSIRIKKEDVESFEKKNHVGAKRTVRVGPF